MWTAHSTVRDGPLDGPGRPTRRTSATHSTDLRQDGCRDCDPASGIDSSTPTMRYAPRTICTPTSTASGWRRTRSRPTAASTAPSSCCATGPRRTCDLIVAAAASHTESGTDECKIGDLYASFMDTSHIEALGIGPISDELAAIDAVTTTADLARRLGRLPAPRRLRPDRLLRRHRRQRLVALPRI